MTAAHLAATWIRESSVHAPDLTWEHKARADFVTHVDRGAEERIAHYLLSHFPESTVQGEELSPHAHPQGGLTFIVDPLDGTTNFLHGYPQYAVSIAAMLDGTLLSGVVLDVPRGDVWSAVAGRGAYRNDAPVSVSRIHDPARALIGTGFPFKDPADADRYLLQFARVMRSVAGIRRAGAAALDLIDVAGGRLDAFWEMELAPWDIAAGMLIVREAGGRVTDFTGRDVAPGHGPVLATNGILHDWMCAQLDSRTPTSA